MPLTVRRRTRSSSRTGTAGQDERSAKLIYPQAQGLHVLRHCLAGLHRAAEARRATCARSARPTTATCRWRSPPTGGARGKAVHARRRRLRGARSTRRRARRDGRHLARHAHRRGDTEEAKVVVLAAGCVETPRLWLNTGLPNPNDQVGRGLTDHYLDYLVGRFTTYTGSTKGPTSAARVGLPRFRRARAGGRVAGAAGSSSHLERFGHRGLLRQRRSGRRLGSRMPSAASWASGSSVS